MGIKKLREERGLTQQELADGIGVRQSTVNMWEKKKSFPYRKNMEKLAQFLKIEPEKLYAQLSKDFC